MAAISHGATRLTDDLDICPEWTTENLNRVAAVLTELGAEIAIGPDQSVPVPVIDGVLVSRIEISTWVTNAGRFDILSSIPSAAERRVGYENLIAGSVKATFGGHELRVIDLDSLIRSKRVVDRPKDREALVELDAIAERLRSDSL